MNIFARKMCIAALLAAVSPAKGSDLPADPSTAMGSDAHSQQTKEHGDHGKVPAGVNGASMVGAGKFMFSYKPMFMHMADNYIGTSTVSPQTIATTIPSLMMAGGVPQMYRIVPTSMDVQTHMFNFAYGLNDDANLMAMASYQKKTMQMLAFAGAAGATALGTSASATEGLGDTSVAALWRIYQDPRHEAHLHFGVSLPTGSITKSMTMLTQMNKYMSMRASYGMQLGTGTVDLLPGVSYAGHADNWSWGAAWRGRFAFDNNSEGYRYGDLHELTGWGGYHLAQGVSVTARLLETVQGRIKGSDPLISGVTEGTNPNFYGGKRTDILGGLEIAGAPFGFKNRHLAFEIGKTVRQDLNGPQLGRNWTFNASIGMEI